MPLTFAERAAVAALAKHLYNFLPASGNNSTSFPLAAQRAGIGEAWPPYKPSKEPGIVHMLTWTLENRRGAFCPLMVEIVSQAMTYRKGGNALQRVEMDTLNQLLLGVSFKIPEFHDPVFLGALIGGQPEPSTNKRDAPNLKRISEADSVRLIDALMALTALQPVQRGFAFERFLSEAFAAFDLAPRGSFRNTGEQIDGSFELGVTYLLEAKWQAAKTDAADLRSFTGKVQDKADWARGLFISDSGFTDVGLEAFGRGKPIICMEGLDLFEALKHRNLSEVIALKARRAVETGRPFVPYRDLF
ncbi:MAG: restriction endonuclease [Luteibacter jiangsuensis]